MSDPIALALVLIISSPIIAKVVGEFFAERPVAWERTKIVIDLFCLWIIYGGGAQAIARAI